jgi:hypothetical protein
MSDHSSDVEAAMARAKRMASGDKSIDQHSLSETIQAAEYLDKKSSGSDVASSATFGLHFRKIKFPGAG